MKIKMPKFFSARSFLIGVGILPVVDYLLGSTDTTTALIGAGLIMVGFFGIILRK